MKKLIIIALLLLPLTLTAQKFFRPVSDDLLAKTNERGVVSTWMFRPVVQLSAMQITLSNPTTVQALSSLGTGISYAHFTEANGQPYQNVAASVLLLFGTETTDVSPLEMSVAATVTAWQYLSVGCGFNFMDKTFFILTGISYSFN
jgi:hypothetical protein